MRKDVLRNENMHQWCVEIYILTCNKDMLYTFIPIFFVSPLCLYMPITYSPSRIYNQAYSVANKIYEFRCLVFVWIKKEVCMK
jgi:hypothetical protein